MPQRLTYRRRLCYNTKSNKTKVVKTPGGKNVLHYRKKKGSIPKCGDTGVPLKGVCFLQNYSIIHLFKIKAARPRQLSKMTKRLKTVTRPYGGCLSAAAVRQRIIRAFLVYFI